MPASAQDDAERAAAYVVERVAARGGSRLKQGARRPPLAAASLGPSLDLVASTRLLGVSQPVADALVAWGEGRRAVHMLDDVPSAWRVLAWQARGERCVSLLPEGVDPSPHEDGLAFAMHDLCHLEKFVDPEHHRGQVGFFAAVHAATARREWGAFLARYDAELEHELTHVVADMNGSAVFLFAALKMKLKMAVRRRVARELGRGPGEVNVAGALDADEQAAFDVDLRAMLDLLAMEGPAREGALSVSTRRDAAAAARVLLRYFEGVGEAALEAR